MNTILIGGKVCTPGKLFDPGVLVLDNKSIKTVANKSQFTAPKKANVLDTSKCWILPGFIDIHVHGLHRL